MSCIAKEIAATAAQSPLTKADWDAVPFLDRDGRPNVGVRLAREPKGGRIVDRHTWRGVELALYQENEDGGWAPPPRWRVLIPESPVPVLYVRIGPGEGRIGLSDKPKRVLHRMEHWPTGPCPDEHGMVKIGALICAGGELMQWARLNDAPRGRHQGGLGGYLKTDFNIEWEDGSNYSGRFDLQRDGTEHGAQFHTSVADRVRIYAGLSCPPHMPPDNYFEMLCNPDPGMQQFSALCRHVLARCEL